MQFKKFLRIIPKIFYLCLCNYLVTGRASTSSIHQNQEEIEKVSSVLIDQLKIPGWRQAQNSPISVLYKTRILDLLGPLIFISGLSISRRGQPFLSTPFFLVSSVLIDKPKILRWRQSLTNLNLFLYETRILDLLGNFILNFVLLISRRWSTIFVKTLSPVSSVLIDQPEILRWRLSQISPILFLYEIWILDLLENLILNSALNFQTTKVSFVKNPFCPCPPF